MVAVLEVMSPNNGILYYSNNYKPGRALLIYASAENLYWFHNSTVPERFRSEDACNRYRVVYEQSDRDSEDFFPDVGIQPMTDGGLFAAGLFIAEKYGLQQREKPRSFLETIAVTNQSDTMLKVSENRWLSQITVLSEKKAHIWLSILS